MFKARMGKVLSPLQKLPMKMISNYLQLAVVSFILNHQMQSEISVQI